MSPHTSRLDAEQGVSEARNEPYRKYGDVSTGVDNTAMRQESPAQKTGSSGRVTAGNVRHIVIDARIINSTTGRYVERLISNLEHIDHDNTYTILVPSKDKNYWTPTNPNFTVKTADFANYSLAEQTKFKTFLDTLAPDLVHFCMPQQPVLYKGKHVTTVHDLTLLQVYNSDKNWLVYHAKQLIGRYVFKKIAHTSSHIITPTEYTKKAYVDFARIPENKVTVTLEATDPPQAATTPYDVPFKQFIMYVGQQSDYKNIKRLGDAHQKLLRTYPDLGLVLVGKINAGAEKNQQYFEKNHYKNIHFTGFVSDEQLSWLYQNCAAYVFPSLMEGFGLPGLEAMAHGAPVASSNATCLPEVYGDAAHYFDPTNTEAIATTVGEILNDEQLRKSLIEKGSAKVKEYSWQRMAQQTHDIYMHALKSS